MRDARMRCCARASAEDMSISTGTVRGLRLRRCCSAVSARETSRRSSVAMPLASTLTPKWIPPTELVTRSDYRRYLYLLVVATRGQPGKGLDQFTEPRGLVRIGHHVENRHHRRRGQVLDQERGEHPNLSVGGQRRTAQADDGHGDERRFGRRANLQRPALELHSSVRPLRRFGCLGPVLGLLG